MRPSPRLSAPHSNLANYIRPSREAPLPPSPPLATLLSGGQKLARPSLTLSVFIIDTRTHGRARGRRVFSGTRRRHPRARLGSARRRRVARLRRRRRQADDDDDDSVRVCLYMREFAAAVARGDDAVLLVDGGLIAMFSSSRG